MHLAYDVRSQTHTLRAGVAVLGPVERVTVRVEQCVLLLNAEPRLLGRCALHRFVTSVGFVTD